MKSILKELTDLVRFWIRKNVSHPYKLMWKQLYNDIQEEIDAIATMRDSRDHPILEDLQELLSSSIEDYHDICTDLNIAETWIFEINNILLWKIYSKWINKWKRDMEKHKLNMSSKKVSGKFLSYILHLEKTKNRYSEFLQEYIRHIRQTYNNWKDKLFTCYDIKKLPNTNLALELYHSSLKRKHRRMTWKKNSQQYLLLHWVQATQCLNLTQSNEELKQLLISSDYKKILSEQQKENEKSKKRWKFMRTRQNLNNLFDNLKNDWFNAG